MRQFLRMKGHETRKRVEVRRKEGGVFSMGLIGGLVDRSSFLMRRRV